MPDNINIGNLNAAKKDPNNAKHMGRRSGGEIAIDLAGAGLGALGGYALSRYVAPEADTLDRVLHTAAGGAAGLLATSLLVDNIKAPDGFDGSYREYMRARALTDVSSTGRENVPNAEKIKADRDKYGNTLAVLGGAAGAGTAIFRPQKSAAWWLARKLVRMFSPQTGNGGKVPIRARAKQVGAGAAGFAAGLVAQTTASAAAGWTAENFILPFAGDKIKDYFVGDEGPDKETSRELKYKNK